MVTMAIIIIYVPIKHMLNESELYDSSQKRDSLVLKIQELEQQAKDQQLKIREEMREVAEMTQKYNDMKFNYDKLQSRHEALRRSRAPIINALTVGDVESYFSNRYKQAGDTTAVDGQADN